MTETIVSVDTRSLKIGQIILFNETRWEITSLYMDRRTTEIVAKSAIGKMTLDLKPETEVNAVV
jgi:hypothetical protein